MTTSRKRVGGKRQGKRATPRKVRLKDLEADSKDVKGGVTPTPGGPVPIPYPNVTGRR